MAEHEYYAIGKRLIRTYLTLEEIATLLERGDSDLSGISDSFWYTLSRNRDLLPIEEDKVAYLKASARVFAVEQAILNASPLTKDTLMPTTRGCLEAGISCREYSGRGAWAFYWMEGGCELTFFPGDEGPQEVSIEEAMKCIGGDQPCTLTPASLKRFNVRNHGSTSTYDPFSK